MLHIEKLVVRYQQLRALRGVSLDVAEGALVALIGSNGSGKTTLLNAVSGLVPMTAGRVLWEERSLTGLGPDEICRKGIIQVPEGRKLFAKMTVDENLEMGAYVPSARAVREKSRDEVLQLFPRLRERRGQMAGSLSGGEQQMLAVARALMARPRLAQPSCIFTPDDARRILRLKGKDKFNF